MSLSKINTKRQWQGDILVKGLHEKSEAWTDTFPEKEGYYWVFDPKGETLSPTPQLYYCFEDNPWYARSVKISGFTFLIEYDTILYWNGPVQPPATKRQEEKSDAKD